MKNTKVKQRLLKLYEEYENKMISKNQIIDFVRDFFYYETFGKSYEDWLSAKEEN
tara:strand:+ start:1250 stop:1414 length:165 start_codon:yes stop_codon:yes gene_type:complete